MYSQDKNISLKDIYQIYQAMNSSVLWIMELKIFYV